MTKLPRITITRTEAGGWLIRCTGCPRFHTIRATRMGADLTATEHRAGHNTWRNA